VFKEEVTLRGATIVGNLELDSSTFERKLDAAYLSVGRFVFARDARFADLADFIFAHIGRSLDLRSSVANYIDLSEAVIVQDLLLGGSRKVGPQREGLQWVCQGWRSVGSGPSSAHWPLDNDVY
jgi:hypothetical protein